MQAISVTSWLFLRRKSDKFLFFSLIFFLLVYYSYFFTFMLPYMWYFKVWGRNIGSNYKYCMCCRSSWLTAFGCHQPARFSLRGRKKWEERTFGLWGRTWQLFVYFLFEIKRKTKQKWFKIIHYFTAMLFVTMNSSLLMICIYCCLSKSVTSFSLAFQHLMKL